MSIRIHHGYRVHTTDPQAFLATVETVIGPVRDELDATLFANIAAEAHDHGWRGIEPYAHATLRDEAMARFDADVTGDRPGTIWHHPHSLDLDYAYPPAHHDGPLYVLIHAQRDAYREAICALPGVEPYGYWDSTDHPQDVTASQWAQRKADWGWLLNGRIRDLMTRWTYREDPAPTVEHIADPAVFAARLPNPEVRARNIARDLAVNEARELSPDMDLRDLIKIMAADTTIARTNELTPLVLPHLPPLDAHSLNQPPPTHPPLPTFAR